jgi:hypothetical protein
VLESGDKARGKNVCEQEVKQIEVDSPEARQVLTVVGSSRARIGASRRVVVVSLAVGSGSFRHDVI